MYAKIVKNNQKIKKILSFFSCLNRNSITLFIIKNIINPIIAKIRENTIMLTNNKINDRKILFVIETI